MRSIITISREFGSGGREIGKKLADGLGIPFYDKELLEMASKESGICQELFVKNDESYTNSFLFSLVMGNYPVSADGRINPDMPLNHKIFLAQFETIKNIAKKGPCVIVGCRLHYFHCHCHSFSCHQVQLPDYYLDYHCCCSYYRCCLYYLHYLMYSCLP